MMVLDLIYRSDPRKHASNRTLYLDLHWLSSQPHVLIPSDDFRKSRSSNQTPISRVFHNPSIYPAAVLHDANRNSYQTVPWIYSIGVIRSTQELKSWSQEKKKHASCTTIDLPRLHNLIKSIKAEIVGVPILPTYGTVFLKLHHGFLWYLASEEQE